ncbi:T9SS type A sorting domain-containing protein [Geofilum sp. OHC36d9]|uniref:T9SS type A sorting domain-containing protein n=1 Tax=Geofilum sp. OHC36d9 TaxID=3458413 RepID=UPI004034EA78
MKIKIVLSLIVVLGLGKQLYSQSSELKLLKKEILTGQDGVDYWLYQYSKTVSSSDTIKLWDRKISSPFKESVLFFIDDEPFANWTHPCRYVFVDKNSKGSYKVLSETSPPTIFEDYSLLSQINIPTGYKYNFSTLKNNKNSEIGLKSAISPGDASYGYKYAVIISGGYNKYNNHERYWNDCEAIYSTLRYVYGFEHHQIFVLMSDGWETGADRHLISGGYDDSPRDFDGDGTTDVTNKATKAAIISLFDMLGEWMLPNDYLYVFTTDHGSLESGNDVKICLWNETEMRDDEFATELNKINAGKISIVMEQCHSGGFVDDLSGNGRVIATACQASQSSYANTDLLYNEFVYHWTAAALGKYPDGTSVDADNNNDGFVTMLEAFEYARDNDTKSETPQYNSQPQSLGRELTNFGFEVNSTLQNITINSGEEQKHYAYNIEAAGDGTSYTVKSGGKSYLKAGNSIVIGPGFSAELGSEFQAFIEPFAIPVLNATSSLKSAKIENSTSQITQVEETEITELLENIKIYPNPSTGLFYFISNDETQVQISVYNSNGSLIIHDNIVSNKWVIDLSDQPSGIYVLKVFSNNKMLTNKLIKQ